MEKIFNSLHGRCTIQNYSSFFLNGITRITFLASLSLHQRPNRCSCPMPAIRLLPSLVNVSEFTKPVTGISNFSLISRKLFSNFHTRMKPSQDPDAIKSVFVNVAMELTQLATPVDETPWASLCTAMGFFFPTFHTLNDPSSLHDRKTSSLTSFTQSMLPECPLYTSCDSSTIFQMRSVPSAPPADIARSL